MSRMNTGPLEKGELTGSLWRIDWKNSYFHKSSKCLIIRILLFHLAYANNNSSRDRETWKNLKRQT